MVHLHCEVHAGLLAPARALTRARQKSTVPQHHQWDYGDGDGDCVGAGDHNLEPPVKNTG